MRVVVAAPLVAGAAAVLDDDEGHHLEVRRASVGDPVEALDGVGGRGLGRLDRAGRHWTVDVDRVQQEPPPPATMLAVGAGDRDRFLGMLEKAVELGVTRVIPLETAHAAAVATRYREATHDKAMRRIREAAKQSGNPWFIVLDQPTALPVLREVVPAVRWLLADATGDCAPLVGAAAAIGWVIGPEGGFTADERHWLINALGAHPVALGRHVLRFETAATAAAALTFHARRQ